MDTELHWDPITEHAWKVSDPDRPANDAAGAIAYVERQRDGSCEVVWLCGATGMQTFASPSQAEIAVNARYRAYLRTERPTATKPVPIAHRPPLAV